MALRAGRIWSLSWWIASSKWSGQLAGIDYTYQARSICPRDVVGYVQGQSSHLLCEWPLLCQILDPSEHIWSLILSCLPLYWLSRAYPLWSWNLLSVGLHGTFQLVCHLLRVQGDGVQWVEKRYHLWIGIWGDALGLVILKCWGCHWQYLYWLPSLQEWYNMIHLCLIVGSLPTCNSVHQLLGSQLLDGVEWLWCCEWVLIPSIYYDEHLSFPVSSSISMPSSWFQFLWVICRYMVQIHQDCISVLQTPVGMACT